MLVISDDNIRALLFSLESERFQSTAKIWLLPFDKVTWVIGQNFTLIHNYIESRPNLNDRMFLIIANPETYPVGKDISITDPNTYHYLEWFRDQENGQTASDDIEAEEYYDRNWPIAVYPCYCKRQADELWGYLLHEYDVNSMIHHDSKPFSPD